MTGRGSEPNLPDVVAVAPPAPDPTGGVGRSQILTLVAMCLAQFMLMLDVTIVNVALPSMQAELHLATGGLEWVISAYSLSLAALIPFGGALGDRYGRKRWFLLGLLVFTAGSISCALSTSGTMLITSRAVQGVGGAVMVALTLSILTVAFPKPRRAWAIGMWGSLGGLGFGFGPLAEGLLLAHFRWSAVFWVNVPIAALTLFFTVRHVRESPRAEYGRFDAAGVLLSGLGLVGIAYGLISASSQPWASPQVAGAFVLGVALLATFVLWERVAPAPMMPLGLFGSRGFTTGMGVYFFNFLVITGAMFYMTLMYQDVKGWTVLATGLSWLCMNIPFVLVAQAANRLNSRFRPAAIVVAGSVSEGVGVLALSRVSVGTPFLLTAVGFLLVGLGGGLMVPTSTHMAMAAAPTAVAGSASGVLNASRQIGASVGLALLGSVGSLAAGRHWAAAVGAMPDEVQDEAMSLAPAVAAGRMSDVAATLGDSARGAAVEAFTFGAHVALLAAAVCMVACTLVALRGVRRGLSNSG